MDFEPLTRSLGETAMDTDDDDHRAGQSPAPPVAPTPGRNMTPLPGDATPPHSPGFGPRSPAPFFQLGASSSSSSLSSAGDSKQGAGAGGASPGAGAGGGGFSIAKALGPIGPLPAPTGPFVPLSQSHPASSAAPAAHGLGLGIGGQARGHQDKRAKVSN